MLNLLPLFNLDWFGQAFISYFGYPCYILTQCGIYFSTFFFIRENLTFLLKFYRTITIKYNLQSNISILSSIAHGFFNIVLYSTQNEDIFVTYLDGFDMNNGQPRPHSIIDLKFSGKKQFDTSNQKYIFPALDVSNNFATLDYDAHINTKIDFTINHVFKSMTVPELNTLHTVCELERTQLLTILPMSIKNPQFAGFLLTGNRSNFLYVEGSTAWLYDCPHLISPLYRADKCFDRIPIHYRETIMYVDPITRQIFKLCNTNRMWE